MWGAIERMSKELQELVQRDATTDGEEEVDMVLATANMDEEEPVPNIEALIFPPFIASTLRPTPGRLFIPSIP